jgi:hypothetical protein
VRQAFRKQDTCVCLQRRNRNKPLAQQEKGSIPQHKAQGNNMGGQVDQAQASCLLDWADPRHYTACVAIIRSTPPPLPQVVSMTPSVCSPPFPQVAALDRVLFALVKHTGAPYSRPLCHTVAFLMAVYAADMSSSSTSSRGGSGSTSPGRTSTNTPAIGTLSGAAAVASAGEAALQQLEEDIFWTAAAMMETLALPQGLRVEQAVLEGLVARKLPRLASHLVAIRVRLGTLTGEGSVMSNVQPLTYEHELSYLVAIWVCLGTLTGEAGSMACNLYNGVVWLDAATRDSAFLAQSGLLCVSPSSLHLSQLCLVMAAVLQPAATKAARTYVCCASTGTSVMPDPSCVAQACDPCSLSVPASLPLHLQAPGCPACILLPSPLYWH